MSFFDISYFQLLNYETGSFILVYNGPILKYGRILRYRRTFNYGDHLSDMGANSQTIENQWNAEAV